MELTRSITAGVRSQAVTRTGGCRYQWCSHCPVVGDQRSEEARDVLTPVWARSQVQPWKASWRTHRGTEDPGCSWGDPRERRGRDGHTKVGHHGVLTMAAVGSRGGDQAGVERDFLLEQ